MKYILIFFILLISSSGNSSADEGRCISGNCKDGSGKYVYKNGDSYSGDFYYSVPHGYGTLIFDSGESIYTGEFKLGFKDGFGSAKITVDKHTHGVKYVGKWKEDEPYGYGEFDMYGIGILKGNWTSSGSGTGIELQADAFTQVGDMVMWEPHGTSVIIFKNDSEKMIRQYEYGKVISEKRPDRLKKEREKMLVAGAIVAGVIAYGIYKVVKMSQDHSYAYNSQMESAYQRERVDADKSYTKNQANLAAELKNYNCTVYCGVKNPQKYTAKIKAPDMGKAKNIMGQVCKEKGLIVDFSGLASTNRLTCIYTSW